MSPFVKKKLLMQKMFLLFIILIFQGCQSQEKKDEKDIELIQKNASVNSEKISYSGYVDFRYAAKIATPGVVNIKCSFKPRTPSYENGAQNDFHNIPDPLKDFFKSDPFFRQFRFPKSPQYDAVPSIGSASGVILTPDGFIITNNHVIKDSDEIKITLFDGRTFTAKVVGTDPQTDLALLKIDAQKLSFIAFGDSNKIEVGEWVVAVGNPFNLASTVTVGIVSAKARNINILKDQGAVESFIQTDAAVNPGNSGGALVNVEGKLIGINTAIATPTGAYAGYSFAIPVDIVKKVANDLMNYGIVQRAVLGISIRDLNSELAKEINIPRANGVYVDSVMVGGAAKEAGIRNKDVIISIDGMETKTSAKLQEIITQKRPGEKVKIKLIRNSKEEKEIIATLKKQEKNTPSLKSVSSDILKDLGIELVEINSQDKKKYNLTNGVKISKIYNGTLKKYTSVRVGFVITSVNNQKVNSVQEFIAVVKAQQGGIMLQGKYAGNPIFY
jgi:serine protease Do